jgi:prophage tail gpP-like protein
MPDVQLAIGGAAYGGWKSIQITRSMEQCAGGFRLGVNELWPGQAEAVRVRPGEACEVRIDGQRVITGYVDSVEMSIDDRQHQLTVAGRDKTADLVDCAAIRKTGQWRGARIEQIAQDLADPFGVSVLADVDTGKPLPSFALQEGESAFEAIERAARIRALLLLSSADGELVITRAGALRAPTPLILGTNLLELSVAVDMRDRFSQYVAKGQAPGSDFFSGANVAQMKAQAADPEVLRYRPFVLTSDCPDLAATLAERALWEAKVRAAKSQQVEATVVDWSHATGLWQPNTQVRVVAEAMQLDQDLLITQVDHTLDERGTTSTLRMTRPDAYSLLPMRAAPAGQAAAFWTMPKTAEGAR